MDIADWLCGLSLERYVDTFRANAIEVEVLPDLSEADLEQLGVLLGHRKLMLRAIAALREPEPQPVAEVASGRADTAERRQLTVMFCDLVGSTELSSRLDPEDYREVIAAYHRAVAKVVQSFDGFLAKYMGDGVLVYFGYPRAHEDDAERAVRAGLACIDAVVRLNIKSVKLKARLGIATVHMFDPSCKRGSGRAYSSNFERSMRRPRNRRDITVPSGTSSTSAISL